MTQPVPIPPPAPPRAFRTRDGAWVGGVCRGLANHLGWSVLVLRVAFVVLTAFNLLGVIAYALLWLWLPAERPAAEAPGLEANARGGLRARPDQPLRSADVGAIVAIVVFGLGLLWLAQISGLGVEGQLFWPVAVGCVGLGLLWRQADQAPAAPAGPRRWYTPLLARSGWLAVARVVLGLVLVAGAVGVVIVNQAGAALLPQVLAMVALALVGVGLVVAPWALRARQALRTAREEKLLADARADMAAHLHDSVLQTLALIQRQAEDPRAVAALARRQERELRTWLYGDTIRETTLKAALAAAAAEIEDERGVSVELVTVGDCPLDADGLALVRAAREAILNAAKHAGVDLIDVYAEADEHRVEVFVRDRGCGFVVDEVAPDRQGVRSSIVDRMARHGGRATVRTAPGEGTEVRLELDRG